MRSVGTTSLGLLATVLGIACSASSTDPAGETTGAQSQAVWTRDSAGNVVASNDADGPRTNVVVRIPHYLQNGQEDLPGTACTGVLISGSLVLTSKYCVSQTKGGLQPKVQIGRTRSVFTVRSSLPRTAVMPDAFVGAVDKGDLALVFLEPQSSPDPGPVAGVLPRRPRTTPPAWPAAVAGLTTAPKIELVGWSRYAFTDFDMTTEAYPNDRQAAPLDNAKLWWLTRDNAAAGPFFVRRIMDGFDTTTARVGLGAGDMGGPLYFYPTATQTDRELVGLATTIGTAFEQRTPDTLLPGSCPDGMCDAWIDLTAPSARDWITANAQDHSHDTGTNWNQMHPRADGAVRSNNVPDWWYGESDANGTACNRALDADCDGWNDLNTDGSKRDNCPGVANPDQKDADDDGFGDVCATCMDQVIDSPRAGLEITPTPQYVQSQETYGTSACNDWVVEWNASFQTSKTTQTIYVSGANLDAPAIAESECRGGTQAILYGRSRTDHKWSPLEGPVTAGVVPFYHGGVAHGCTFNPIRFETGPKDGTNDRFRVAVHAWKVAKDAQGNDVPVNVTAQAILSTARTVGSGK